MEGGLIQLAVKGREDVHLTSEPEFSYYENVYKKHTNFSIQNNIYNIIGKKFGQNFEFKIPMGSDLLSNINLEVFLPKLEENIQTKNITENILDYNFNINNLKYYLLKLDTLLYLVPEYIFLNNIELVLDNLDRYLLNDNNFSFIINSVDNFYIINFDEIKLLNLKTDFNEKILLFNLNNNKFSKNDFLSTSKIYEKYETTLNNIIFNNFDFYYNATLNEKLIENNINLSSFGEVSNFYYKITDKKNIFNTSNITTYTELIDIIGSYFDFITYLYGNHFNYNVFINYFMDQNFSNTNPSRIGDIVNVLDLINPLNNFSTIYKKNYQVQQFYEQTYNTTRTAITQIYDNILIEDKKTFYLNALAITKYFANTLTSPLFIRNNFLFPNKIDIKIRIINDNLLEIKKTTTNKAIYDVIISEVNLANLALNNILKNANILANQIMFLVDLIELFDNNIYVKDIQGFNNYSTDFIQELNSLENINIDNLNLPYDYLPIKIKELGPLIFLRNKVITLLYKLINNSNLKKGNPEGQVNFNAYLDLDLKNILTLRNITDQFDQLLNNNNLIILCEDDLSGNINLVNKLQNQTSKPFINFKMEEEILIVNNSIGLVDLNGFFLVNVNFEPKSYAKYYINNELIEYIKDESYFFKFKESKNEYLIKEVYERDIPYVEFQYDISNNDSNKFPISKYEKLQDCKIRKYLIFDNNIDLIIDNRIILNLEKEIYFIDISNNVEFLSTKNTFDYESKFYLLRMVNNGEVIYRRVKYLGYNNGIIIDENINDKYLFSKIELYIFNSIFIDVKMDIINNIPKPILFRNITNKILENYDFDELNYLYNIHFNSDISNNINDLYKLVDYEFLNMANSFKLLTLKRDAYYIYGTIDNKTGYYYPVYLTELEAMVNDKDRLAIEKTILEYDFKIYISNSNFNYSVELTDTVKSFNFIERIENSVNVKLNRKDLSNNYDTALNTLDNFELEVINKDGVDFNRIRLYHNRKLPNLMNFTSSSIAEFPKDIVYDYFVQQPMMIKMNNSNMYLITNINGNSLNIYINGKKAVNLCKISSNQLLRNNFTKMSFNFDDDILLVSKKEIKNIYNNLLTSKYNYLVNIDEIINLIINNEKSSLELIKRTSDLSRTVIDLFSDKYINVSDNILKYHLDSNNQTYYHCFNNIFISDVSDSDVIDNYNNNLILSNKFINLPWRPLTITSSLSSSVINEITNIKNYLIENVNVLIRNENLLNLYNSSNIELKLIENYQTDLYNSQINYLPREVEFYNKSELNVSFLDRIIYNDKKIDFQVDINNNKVFLNREDIVETDFYKYCENQEERTIDINYITIKNNKYSKLIINDPIFSIIIDDDNNFITNIQNIDQNIYDPLIFNINKEAVLLNENNYIEKVRYVYVFENLNYPENVYSIKNNGILDIRSDFIYLISYFEIKNVNLLNKLIVKEIDSSLNQLIINLENIDLSYNNNPNNESLLIINGNIIKSFKFYNIFINTESVNSFVYYENGSYNYINIDNLILFNVENISIEKIILVEKDKVNRLSVIENGKTSDLLITKLENELFSDKYIFDNSINNIVNIENGNYLVYYSDYQDFYLDLSISINNYNLIINNNNNNYYLKSLLGGFIYFNNFYWKLNKIENNNIITENYQLLEPLTINNYTGIYKVRLPIITNDIYNYRFNTSAMFSKNYNLSWNFIDGMNIDLSENIINIITNDKSYILSRNGNYKFNENIYSNIKFIDTSNNIERVLTIVNNQSEFNYDISSGIEGNLINSGSYIYLDNSNVIVSITELSNNNIINAYTDNLLFSLSVNQSNIIVRFDYDNLTNDLNEGKIFIQKSNGILNIIKLVVYKNVIYNRLNITTGFTPVLIEPVNLLSTDLLNISDLSINFNEDILEINNATSLRVRNYSSNVIVNYSINGIYSNIDDYKINNLLTYDLNYNIINNNKLQIYKSGDNFVVSDEPFINKYPNVEIYDIVKEVMYKSNGYIDQDFYIYSDINLVDDLIIKINGNYYMVIQSFGKISKLKISENNTKNINYPLYFDKIIILGRFINNTYNYVDHLLHVERNNLFKAIENVNILNKGDYFIKDNSLNVYINQDISNCFGSRGNTLTLTVFKNMVYINRTFLLDIKILDKIYDISDNYEEYIVERILDNVILLNKEISNSVVVKNLYISVLNYELDISNNDDNNLIVIENNYGLMKKVKFEFEFKPDLCVNWYSNSPNRYSNKVKFNRISNNNYQLDNNLINNNLSIELLNFYYNQVLGVCKDFFVLDYAKIKGFDYSNNIIITDIDISLDSLLFVFDSTELLRDDILVKIDNINHNNYQMNVIVKPCYDNLVYKRVNLLVLYLRDLNCFSSNFIVDLYVENDKYKFRSEDLKFYENSYYLGNNNVMYVIDGLNLVNLVEENNFVYRIEPKEVNPLDLLLITEYYENNRFLTLVKMENNKIISNLKIHSNESKFYVNNLFEVKIRNNVLEYQRPKIKLIKNYRDITDNYIFVFVVNITQKEPIFDTQINKFIIEIDFLQVYEDLILENLLLYKVYREIELKNLVKLIKRNNKIYIETDKLFNYDKLYIVQNNQLKIVNDFKPLDNVYENNIIKKSLFLHSFIEIEWYGIFRNYEVINPKLELINKNIDINKPFNNVLKIYEVNENIIIETESQLPNIPNITNIKYDIDIYQTVITNNIDITTYSTINNLKFINFDLNLLYKFSRNNKNLLNNLSLFKPTKNVRFEYNGVISSTIIDNSSIFLEDEIFYYEVFVGQDISDGFAFELRQMANIILDTIEEYNNFGFWISWKEVLENKLNVFGYTIEGNCLHKLTEELDIISELSDFIKTENGYIRKNPITLDVDIIEISSNIYVLRRDIDKLNNYIYNTVDTTDNKNLNRFGINIDILLNNLDMVLNNNIDINYVYRNEIKSLYTLYLENLWNKYKYDKIYENINPDIEFGDVNKLYKYEILLNKNDNDTFDNTDIKIYNEQQIDSAIILNKKAIFYENDINTDILTLSTYVRYPILKIENLGKYYRIDMNNNTFDDNLRIKLGEKFINLLKVEDRVMYVGVDNINEIDHIEYVNNIYVKNGNSFVLDYNSSFTFQKSYIFDGSFVYFIPNNYQNTKIYFYCNQFGINLGLNYNLDISKNEIDYQVKINVQIINNRLVFDTSLNNYEIGKIYLFDQSHISNLNYSLRVAKDLSFNNYYYNSYGLPGDNGVLYFAPVELGKVIFYVESYNLDNIINDPYEFGVNVNGLDIIDGSENLVIVDVSTVGIIPNVTYSLSNTLFETGKIYKFNIINFEKKNFGLSLNLYYLYRGDTYIPIILDDKLVNASSSLLISNFTVYELIEVKSILNIVDLNKNVYKITSETINRNEDYISNNVEESIFVENKNGEIIKPFRVFLNSLSEFVVMTDISDISIINIIHFSNLNQSLPLNINSIELKNIIIYDIYVDDELITENSKLVVYNDSDIINGNVNISTNKQFTIESDRYLELENKMIINNIFETNYRTDISNVYIKIPDDLLLTFISDYDLRYIISVSDDIILDYSGLLIIDTSNINLNEIKISKTDIGFVDGMELFINQYVKYEDINKLFDKAIYFNTVNINPNLEIDYESYLIEIRNNDNFDFIYGIDLSDELIDFNYYVDKMYLIYNGNKLVTLDFIYLDQDSKKKIIVGSNINISNINKLLVKNVVYDINGVINIKKQFRGQKVGEYFLVESDIININSNYLSDYYKLKISGFNKIKINNKFITEEIKITKDVEIIETVENKLVERKYIDDVVFRLFKKIGFYINDELVEELTPDIYKMIYNFHFREDQRDNILKLRKDGDNYKFSLPLEFWFKRNHLNLPLIAMNNTNLYLKLEVEELNKLIDIPIKNNNVIKIMVDMDTILLEDNERMLFGTRGHEYLIERYVDYQNYRINKLQSVNRIPIKGLIKNIYWFGYNFETNEPYIKNETVNNEEKYQEYLDLVKRYNLYLDNKLPFESGFVLIIKNKKILLLGNDLVIAIRNNKLLSLYDIEFVLFLYEKYINPKNNIRSIINRLNMYFSYLYYSKTIIKKDVIMKEINIKINGTTLFGKRDNLYYGNVIANKNLINIPDDNYYFISFALYPEELQPSGHLNFNKLDEFVIISNNDERVVNQAYQLKVIVKEYQIIKIIGGMSSLMW
jgi:hypothetical protein